jgi:uncharacterized sulfatase
VTIAEALKAAGYATGHYGKWHLGGKGFGPKEQGFDAAIEWQAHTIPGPRQEPPSDRPKRAVEYLTDKTIAFIDANKDRPFYVQLQPFAVHIPLSTTPELQAKYEQKPKVEGYSCHPTYAGLLEELDIGVGRVLEALDKLGLSENTIFVFTSDNGGLEREVGGWPGTLNRPLRKEKGTLYEGGLRVPAIIRWPGVTPAGGVQDAPAISMDFYPTFVEACSARYGTEMIWEGLSLAPMCRAPGVKSSRAALYWHYPHYHHSRPSGAIRAGDWKLIEFFDTGALELYNLKDDVSEARDLAKAEPERVATLHGMLKRWRQEINAQMPQANPAYDPKRAGEWWNRATLKPTEAPGTYRPSQ